MSSRNIFKPSSVAVTSDGQQEIIPQSKGEEDFLKRTANRTDRTPQEKDRIGQLGALFEPMNYDMDFNDNRQKILPDDLDPQLRKLIREV